MSFPDVSIAQPFNISKKMDTIQILPYLPTMLSILTLVCAWVVIPYRLNQYNTDWLPAWLHPYSEAVDSTYRSYYPADEARWMLAASFFVAFVYITAFLCTGKYECIHTGVPYLYALIPAAYLLHRYFCFHRVNRFTPEYVAERTSPMMIYRPWMVVLLWLYTFILPAVAVFQCLPPLYLRLLTLPPVIAMLLYTGAELASLCREYRKDYSKCNPWQCLSSAIPQNYYFALAVVSVALTQAALWSDSLVPLIVWTVILTAFTVTEFHYRFCCPPDKEIDMYESWGTDDADMRLSMDEELDLIRCKEYRMLHRKRYQPCQMLIISGRKGLHKYTVDVTADLDNKLRELLLRKEKLLYVGTFDTLKQTRLNALYTGHSDSRMEELIQRQNPGYHDLKVLNTNILMTY